MKPVLLIGASGLVGTDMFSYLVKENINLFGTSRKGMLKSNATNFIKADILNGGDEILKLVDEVDCIILNAGEINDGKNFEDLEALRIVNMDFASRLSKKALESGGKTLIYIGSLSILARPLQSLIRESDPISPATPYAVSKFWAEKSILSINNLRNCRSIVLRISSPVPKHFENLGNTVLKKWINNALQNIPIAVHGKGEREQDFVSVSDISQAIKISIYNKNISGIFHIASGKSLSMAKLAEIIDGEFHNGIRYEQEVNKNVEKWRISIDKAGKELDYVPIFDSESVVRDLIQTLL